MKDAVEAIVGLAFLVLVLAAAHIVAGAPGLILAGTVLLLLKAIWPTRPEQ